MKIRCQYLFVFCSLSSQIAKRILKMRYRFVLFLDAINVLLYFAQAVYNVL